YGVDEKDVSRANAALSRALAGGRHLTRAELSTIVRASGPKLAGILMRAEIEAVICSGPRRGKQFTWSLVDERCPPAPPVERDEALGRLAGSYFRSHGPALVQDFSWWSGLTAADARRAIEIAGLTSSDGHWSKSWTPAKERAVHLLPNFDEFLVAYNVRARRELSQTFILDGRMLTTPRTAAERRAVAEARQRWLKYQQT